MSPEADGWSNKTLVTKKEPVNIQQANCDKVDEFIDFFDNLSKVELVEIKRHLDARNADFSERMGVRRQIKNFLKIFRAEIKQFG